MIHKVIDGIEQRLATAVQRIEHTDLEGVELSILEELQSAQYAVQGRSKLM
jgi:hypothetical protein